MYWLFLLFALACLGMALKTPHMGLMALSLLGTLVFLLAWVRGLYVARFGDVQPTRAAITDPNELRRLRELALQARTPTAQGESDPS